jgi:hypothetical protein
MAGAIIEARRAKGKNMSEIQMTHLTQAALVAALKERGYAGINERSIGVWRRKGLLPEFDIPRPGRGRAAGRQFGAWANGEDVVNRATWVARILPVYKRVDSVYLPLWILGYPIPLELVKKALRQPLTDISRSIRTGMKEEKDISLEDFIDQGTDDAYRDARRKGLNWVQTSPVVMGICSQLFFNKEYNLEDAPFKRTVDAFKLKQKRRQKRPETSDENFSANLFEFAPFFKEHLSFARVREAIQQCSDADLRVVARDLGIVREIVDRFGRIVKAQLSAAPTEFLEWLDDKFHVLFTLGRICILIDLSLRRAGHGDRIDNVLPDLLNQVRTGLTEELEEQFRANSAQFISASQAATNEWAEKLKAKAATVSTRKPVRRAKRVSRLREAGHK